MFNGIWHNIILILHILFAVAAIGAVTVTDYLHLTGLKNKIREKKLLFVYPLLGRMIIYLLAGIILTGIILVMNEPELLSNSLFRLKMWLFLVVIANGWLLHSYVSPHLNSCVLKGGRINCSRKTLLISALSGSISIASWYGILILTFTKEIGYGVMNFLIFYVLAIAILFAAALYLEKKARKWE